MIDDNGRTPLALTIRSGIFEWAQLLLEKGANLEARDRFGYTPLVLAVRRGNFEAVQFLLDRGANPDELSPSVKLVYDDVCEDDFNKAIKLVRKAQSKNRS